MLKKKQLRSAVKPIIGALALALSSQMAYAVDVNQIPANGYVVAGGATSTATTAVNGVAVANGMTITLTSNSVIDWAASASSTTTIQGKTVTINQVNASVPGGFDIGPNAGVEFTGNTGTTTPTNYAVLNVDISGNPSVIAGQLQASGPLYVANANGIVVAGGSQIVAPVMGFINADLSSTQATQLFEASGVIPLSFAGSGGVQIQAGANLSNASTLIVAGAGMVNVDGVSGVTNYIPNTQLIVDGGMGGYISSASGAPAFTSSMASADFPVQDASTNVALNLGTTSSPFNFQDPSLLLANGNVSLSGVMANAVDLSTFNWTGTLTNNGVFNANNQTGATLATVSNKGTISAAGGLVNDGTLAGYSSFTAGSFNNQGNLVLTGTQANSDLFQINAGAGTVTLGGVITGPIPMTGISGGTVNINTTMANVGGNFNVAAGTLNITSIVSATSGNSFTFDANTNGVFNLASTGSISADNVYLAPGLAVNTVDTNFVVNGGIIATASSGSVTFGGDGSSSSSANYGTPNSNMVENVSGSGFITADNVTFNSLLGAVNNITTPNMFQNGFTINNATSGGMTNITFNAVNGNTINQQGVNLNVNGNATIGSGNTVVEIGGNGSVAGGFTSPGRNAGNFTPNNANSRLVVQASGTLSTDGSLNFPGLVYLSAANSMTVNSLIDNAYALTAPAGYGIWMVSPNITDYSGFLTVGNRAVNFVSPNANANSAVLGGWGSAAQIVNGLDLSNATAAQVSGLAQGLTIQQIQRLNFTNSAIDMVPGYLSFNGNTLAQ